MHKFWESSNFWIATILAIGGLFVGFPEGAARDAVSSIFIIIASAGALRERLKNAQIDAKKWLSSANTWNYIATAITSAFSFLPPDLFTQIQALFSAIFGGNWQGATAALFSIATILYHILKPDVRRVTT
jgi:hypothetical protein